MMKRTATQFAAQFVCAVLPLCASGQLFAQSETAPSLLQNLNPSGSVRAAYFSASRKLDEKHDLGAGAVWLKFAPTLLDKKLTLVVDGWLRNDESFDHKSTGKLREGHLDFSAGSTDFRIGKQIIVWGRADELNPTDNLNPRDYTLLTPETNDQRFGVAAAKAAYHYQDWALTGIWLPRFSANIFPTTATPGVYYTRPTPHGNQGAIKLERSGGAVDWSVSYFSGLDLNPDSKIGGLSASGLNLILENKRIHVVGFDAATVVGRYGLRTEAAYTWTSYVGDPQVKKPFLYAVVGADRTFFTNLNINAQYFFRRVAGYQDPRNITDPILRPTVILAAGIANQLDRFQHGMSIRIANKWLNDTLEGEIAGVLSFTRHDYTIKPKLIYAFNDQVKGTLGLDVFRGDSETYYGRLRKNSSLYAEIKYSF